MEKAESFSFPSTRVWGSRQSLRNEILVGAKRLNCHCPTFLLSFVIRFPILFPTHSYHTSQRIYANPTAHHQKNTPEHGRHNGNCTERRHVCSPTHLAHRPSCTCAWKGGGQNWPLASAGIAVVVAATPQPWQCIFRVTMRGSWTSPLNRRGR
jgi:hypothetical protein